LGSRLRHTDLLLPSVVLRPCHLGFLMVRAEVEERACVAIVSKSAKIFINDLKAVPIVFCQLGLTGDVGGIPKADHSHVPLLASEAVSSISKATGRHFDGLGQALREIRRQLPNSLVRKLQHVQAANCVLRHYSDVWAAGLVDQLERCLDGCSSPDGWPAAAPPAGRSRCSSPPASPPSSLKPSPSRSLDVLPSLGSVDAAPFYDLDAHLASLRDAVKDLEDDRCQLNFLRSTLPRTSLAHLWDEVVLRAKGGGKSEDALDEADRLIRKVRRRAGEPHPVGTLKESPGFGTGLKRTRKQKH